MGKIMGETPPDVEQGTPVQEVDLPFPGTTYTNIVLMITSQILKRHEEGQQNAPKVMQENLKSPTPKGSRSFSTSARRRQEAMITFEDDAIETQGHKFGLPDLPIQSMANMKYRYDPVVKQVTSLLMKDGKLSKAQRVGPSRFLFDRLLAISSYLFDHAS